MLGYIGGQRHRGHRQIASLIQQYVPTFETSLAESCQTQWIASVEVCVLCRRQVKKPKLHMSMQVLLAKVSFMTARLLL